MKYIKRFENYQLNEKATMMSDQISDLNAKLLANDKSAEEWDTLADKILQQNKARNWSQLDDASLKQALGLAKSMMKKYGLKESLQLNEGDVNLKDQFALVRIGGSIGEGAPYPIFVKGGIGTVIETGNDFEELKTEAARRRKGLSPGERKHYGMSYTAIKLTPYKIKEIQQLKDARSKSINESYELNEGKAAVLALDEVTALSADDMEQFVGFLSSYFYSHADTLTNMDAKGIAKDLLSAHKKLKKRTGN